MDSAHWKATTGLVLLGAALLGIGVLSAAAGSASVVGNQVAAPPTAEGEPARAAVRRPTRRAPAAAVRHTPVPILMYHVIADPPIGVPYPGLFVSRADFEGQMRWLERRGYRPVTLRAVWDHWHRGAALSKKPIVITFDDGYREVAHEALPTMRERKWPGVLNLTVKNVGASGGLSDRQIRRLITAGWEIDAHSLTHPDLTGLDDERLAREVGGARRELRRRFDVAAEFFCYPSGRYDTRVIAAVRRAGYLGATTTIEGLADPHRPYELERVRVSRSDGIEGFARKLERFPGA